MTYETMRWQDIPASEGYVEVDMAALSVFEIRNLLFKTLKEDIKYTSVICGHYLESMTIEDNWFAYRFTVKDDTEYMLQIRPEKFKLNFYLQWRHTGYFGYDSEPTDTLITKILVAFKKFGDSNLTKRLEIPITEEYVKL